MTRRDNDSGHRDYSTTPRTTRTASLTRRCPIHAALRGVTVLAGPTEPNRSLSRFRGVTVQAGDGEVSVATYAEASVVAERCGGVILVVAP